MARAAILALTLLACSDKSPRDEPQDAGLVDAGPYVSGELSCAHDVSSDYATRVYSFADGFDRQGLGPYWHTGSPEQWTIEGEARLVLEGEGEPGALAMVSDGKTGTQLVVWAEVTRDVDWSGGPIVACRADGPPMRTGYGARIDEDRLEIVEIVGGAASAPGATAELGGPLQPGSTVRVVVGCTAQVVTAFALLVGSSGRASELGCASWSSGIPIVGAIALTHSSGRTVFDNVRVEIEP